MIGTKARTKPMTADNVAEIIEWVTSIPDHVNINRIEMMPVMQAFCGPGEQLVGWMVLGTPRKTGTPKFDKPDAADVMSDWPPA